MAFCRLLSAIQCSAGLRSRLRPSGQTEKRQSQPELATLPYRTYLPHQHSRAPEVQTTGDTTPVQQIVYAKSLTTSGGSNA